MRDQFTLSSIWLAALGGGIWAVGEMLPHEIHYGNLTGAWIVYLAALIAAMETTLNKKVPASRVWLYTAIVFLATFLLMILIRNSGLRKD